MELHHLTLSCAHSLTNPKVRDQERTAPAAANCASPPARRCW
jgi:hypothetical protein